MNLCWICRYSQLQSDLKITNMQEMKITVETYFEEVLFYSKLNVFKKIYKLK